MMPQLNGSRRTLGWVGGAAVLATISVVILIARARRARRRQAPAGMEHFYIDDDVAVGMGQPNQQVCGRFALDGFRAVLDLRLGDEEGQALSPGEECEVLTRQGVAYAHFPVPVETPDDVLLARFRHELSGLPKPVLVHCATGKRSGTLALMHHAIDRGLSGEQMLMCAEEAGVLYGPMELRQQIADFVDRQQSASRRMSPRPLYGNGAQSFRNPA